MALPVKFMRHHSEHHQSPDTDGPTPPSHAIEPPNTNQATASHKPFRFLYLPAELRFEIYREAIATGSTSILQVSHFIHQEAFPLVHAAGIFRILTQSHGPNHRIAAPAADFQPSTLIQNIEIRVTIKSLPAPDKARHWRKPPDVGCIASFTDAAAAAVQRDTCYIEFNKSICKPLHERPEVLLDIIRKLRGFERIIVRVIASGCDGYIGTQRAVIRARNKPVYEMALKELESVFGPGVWHDAAVQEGRYLQFRPK